MVGSEPGDIHAGERASYDATNLRTDAARQRSGRDGWMENTIPMASGRPVPKLRRLSNLESRRTLSTEPNRYPACGPILNPVPAQPQSQYNPKQHAILSLFLDCDIRTILLGDVVMEHYQACAHPSFYRVLKHTKTKRHATQYSPRIGYRYKYRKGEHQQQGGGTRGLFLPGGEAKGY